MDPDEWMTWDDGWTEVRKPPSPQLTPKRGTKREVQDGDMVFNSDGTVHRVGDKPRSRRRGTFSNTFEEILDEVSPPKPTSTEVVRTMGSMELAQEQLKAALMQYAGITALMDRFQGKQPPKGTVLRWLKSFDARSGEMTIEGLDGRLDADRRLTVQMKAPQEYTYLAFRAPDGKWYSTSQRGIATHDWDALLKLIGDNPCWIAEKWLEIPAPEKVQEEAMDPGEWAKLLFSKKNGSETTEASGQGPQTEA